MTGLERVFRRIPGEGWLLLAGAIPELGGETADLMERLLEKLDLSRPMAAMAAPDSDSTEVNELLETLEEWLGAGPAILSSIPIWDRRVGSAGCSSDRRRPRNLDRALP
jgi:hypothetical protein